MLLIVADDRYVEDGPAIFERHVRRAVLGLYELFNGKGSYYMWQLVGACVDQFRRFKVLGLYTQGTMEQCQQLVADGTKHSNNGARVGRMTDAVRADPSLKAALMDTREQKKPCVSLFRRLVFRSMAYTKSLRQRDPEMSYGTALALLKRLLEGGRTIEHGIFNREMVMCRSFLKYYGRWRRLAQCGAKGSRDKYCFQRARPTPFKSTREVYGPVLAKFQLSFIKQRPDSQEDLADAPGARPNAPPAAATANSCDARPNQLRTLLEMLPQESVRVQYTNAISGEPFSATIPRTDLQRILQSYSELVPVLLHVVTTPAYIASPGAFWSSCLHARDLVNLMLSDQTIQPSAVALAVLDTMKTQGVDWLVWLSARPEVNRARDEGLAPDYHKGEDNAPNQPSDARVDGDSPDIAEATHEVAAVAWFELTGTIAFLTELLKLPAGKGRGQWGASVFKSCCAELQTRKMQRLDLLVRTHIRVEDGTLKPFASTGDALKLYNKCGLEDVGGEESGFTFLNGCAPFEGEQQYRSASLDYIITQLRPESLPDDVSFLVSKTCNYDGHCLQSWFERDAIAAIRAHHADPRTGDGADVEADLMPVRNRKKMCIYFFVPRRGMDTSA